MKKFLCTEQAVIRTWRNIKTLGKVPTSHFGHAAVTVVGIDKKRATANGPKQ